MSRGPGGAEAAGLMVLVVIFFLALCGGWAAIFKGTLSFQAGLWVVIITGCVIWGAVRDVNK